MADLSTQYSRRKLSSIYRNKLYEILERYNRKSTAPKREKAQTVAVAIRDMYERGFSAEAIYKDLEDLCITTPVEVDYFTSRVVATPPSHFVLCNR